MIRRTLFACFAATWLLAGGCGADSSLFGGSKKSDTAFPGSEDGGSATTNGDELSDGEDADGVVSVSDGDTEEGSDDPDESNEEADTSPDEEGDDVALQGPKTGDRIIIRFRPGVTASERSALHRRHGLQVDRIIPQLHMHAVKIPPGMTAEEVMARYDRHPLVEFVEQEIIAEPATTPNDPQFGSQGYLHTEGCSFLTGACWGQLDAVQAWGITTGSPSVALGVLDTGLDTSHYEFTGRIARGEIYGYDFKDLDPDFDDTSGHGTAVGGVVGAESNNSLGIAGVNWQNPMVVMRTGFGFDAREAIVWAADNGVRVISMSFGSGISTASFESTCQYAYDRDVVLVAAAGNFDGNTRFYPAAYTTVLAVTGIDGTGEPLGFAWGDWIDVAAHGTGVLTTFNAETDSGGDGLGLIGGTSIATPLVAAAAGLVLSVNPDLTPAQVMDILRNTADDIGDPGFDVLTGHGRLNYYQAVLAASGVVPPPPDTTAPTVAVVDPTDGQVISGVVSVTANASDDTAVAQVDLYCNGSFVDSDAVPPHEWPLDTTTLANGSHSFYAIARDAAGNSAQSPRVFVTIDNGTPCDPVELVGSTCNDGLDNDCDGMIDCDDGDCAADSTCAPPNPDPDPVCNGNAVCESGENCTNCASDCPSGQGASCGNGVCEAGNGEDCLTCPLDCNGKQDGKQSRRYCCGAGGGQNPVGCTDSRCASGGLVCAVDTVPDSCCGDGVCSGDESGADCEVDCGPLPFCGDGTCDADEDPCSCGSDCGAPDGGETSGSTCRDGLDNDCDGTVDCLDSDCTADPMCAGCDHDGVCDAGESCHTCADDCQGKQAGKSANTFCCGNGALEPAEGDGSVCDGNP